MVFSMILGDNVLARLAQHVLVGAALGYVAVLAWQNVLRPRLFAPLFRPTPADPWLSVPLMLGVVLLIAGTDRILGRGRAASGIRSGWRGAVQRVGSITVTAVLGVVLAVTAFGLLQGTLIPQFWQATRLDTAQAPTSGALLGGVLTLLITIGVLLYICVEPLFHTAVPAPSDAQEADGTQPAPGVLRRIIQVWAAAGKRALWLAAGVLFARLMAAYLSLLIARLDYLLQMLERTPVWRLADSVWRLLGG